MRKHLPRISRKGAIAFYECETLNDTFGYLVPVYRPIKRKHKKGDPLLVYPLGEEPLDRGLLVYH